MVNTLKEGELCRLLGLSIQLAEMLLHLFDLCHTQATPLLTEHKTERTLILMQALRIEAIQERSKVDLSLVPILIYLSEV